MRIVLIGKKYIFKEALPKNSIDNYWIIDRTQKPEKKLLNLKCSNGKYEASSNVYSKILDPKYLESYSNELDLNNIDALPQIELVENEVYPILLRDSEELYILFCLPDYESTFNHVDIIGNQEITVGANDNNSIACKNSFMADLHAKIVKFNGKWTVQNYDSKYGLFVNDFPVYGNVKNVFNGDTIFIMGLEIIIINDSLYINDPKGEVELDQKCFAPSRIKNAEIDDRIIENDELVAIDENIKYYSRPPRMIPQIKKEKIEIDEPPQLDDKQNRPMILTLGPSIAMGIMMISSFITVHGVSQAEQNMTEIIVGAVSAIAMLISMLVFPIADARYDKRQDKKYEQKRQKKYKKYLEQKIELVNEIKGKQKELLYKNYPSAGECAKIISKDNPRLWERKIEDSDFLTLRIGIGKVPLQAELAYPKEKFAMVEDNLMNELTKAIDNSKDIEEAPVTISLRENQVTAVVTEDDEFTIKYMKNMVLQLITFQSYDDLKLVFLLDKKMSKEWEFVKMLPHVWDNQKEIRFFADDQDEMNEISKYLIEEINDRIANQNENIVKPYYLIITDDYKKIESLGFISDLAKIRENIGFSLLCITKDIFNLPNSCKTFIDVRNKKDGVLFEKGIDETCQTEIGIEPLITVFFEKISQKLLNIPIRTKKGATSLPENYNFLEMYNVGNIEQLDILGRWKRNDSTLSLKAPIGIDNNGMIISLDAHEKFHGPHGLIAGSTGSGKSEFIITYILSLAINYHPNDVTFLLIDYKGGGLAGAFKKSNIQLPHLVGTITNIDTHGLKRSLISIQSELRRRQIIFNEARDMTNEGTIDIYKYQKLYHDGIVKEAIPHLFIICDEFAELKQQQPDFMEELVSVSRIGRSLGVHLILATQKPSGIVDDQIRSNSKFGVCLKVQDTIDSQDVISTPDAAYLKNPGQFYLRVGQNEYYTVGQSGWAGAQYIPSDFPIKKTDTSVEFISNTGLTIKKIDDTKTQKHESVGEQLTSILEYICNLASEEKIKTKNLWLDSIPQDIYISELKNKYKEKPNKDIEVIIGEYDDPANQEQGLVKLNFSDRNNIIIYGNAESGKETLLSTTIYGLMTGYSTEQVQIYILDFGTEALKIFRKSPHVGDVVFMGEDEKIATFFDMIQNFIKERKQILSDYNGDYNLYLEKGNTMPIIAVVINNYEAFSENYEDQYDDLFLTLTREGSKCGIVFVVTASANNAMRYRLTANFNKKIALQLNDEDDYYMIFDGVGDKRPTRMFGRGLVQIEDRIHEFQTCKICGHAEYNEHIEETIKELDDMNKIKAIPIPTLPSKVELADVASYLVDASKVPIGLVKRNLNVFTYDFKKNFMTVVTSKNLDNATEFSSYLFEELKKLDNTKISILDADEAGNSRKKAYKDFIKQIKSDMKKRNEEFTICAIIGIEKFISEDIIEEYDFSEFLEEVKEKGKHAFIIIESPDKLGDHTYDDWYSKFISQNCGIWIGNGMENQTLINTNFSMDDLENNCGNSFGYIVEEGEPTLLKFIGIEEEDSDE